MITPDDYVSAKDVIIKPPYGGKIAEAPGTRWCAECQHFHAVLYICESYPAELKNEIERDRRKFGIKVNEKHN